MNIYIYYRILSFLAEGVYCDMIGLLVMISFSYIGWAQNHKSLVSVPRRRASGAVSSHVRWDDTPWNRACYSMYSHICVITMVYYLTSLYICMYYIPLFSTASYHYRGFRGCGRSNEPGQGNVPGMQSERPNPKRLNFSGAGLWSTIL